jgi:hypothetical protein
MQRQSEPRTQRSGVSGYKGKTAYSAALRARLGLALGVRLGAYCPSASPCHPVTFAVCHPTLGGGASTVEGSPLGERGDGALRMSEEPVGRRLKLERKTICRR